MVVVEAEERALAMQLAKRAGRSSDLQRQQRQQRQRRRSSAITTDAKKAREKEPERVVPLTSRQTLAAVLANQVRGR